MSNRKKALEAMLESLIKNDNEGAAGFLHDYITAKTREIMLGEQDDDEDESDDEEKEEESKDDDDGDDDSKSDDKDSDDDGDDDDGDDDKDSDDDDDDDGKPAFLKKKKDKGDDKEEVKEGKFTEKPPGLGKQPMTGKGGGKVKYGNGPGKMDPSVKGDSLKGKGTKSSKAFRESPKKAPDYKDGVDHKAGGIKNRAKAG